MTVLSEERDMDLVVLERCRLGDFIAFDELIFRYQNAVYNIAFRCLGRDDEAREVARETFIRAFSGMQDFPDDAHVHTWLFSIVGNLARNMSRDTDDNRDISEMSAMTDDEDILQEALGQIPEHARFVFVLSVFEGLTYDEIAEAAGCPRSTVKSRMNQARVLLRDALMTASVV